MSLSYIYIKIETLRRLPDKESPPRPPSPPPPGARKMPQKPPPPPAAAPTTAAGPPPEKDGYQPVMMSFKAFLETQVCGQASKRNIHPQMKIIVLKIS